MQIEKPITHRTSGLSKAFDELVLSELPVHKFEKEQLNKREGL